MARWSLTIYGQHRVALWAALWPFKANGYRTMRRFQFRDRTGQVFEAAEIWRDRK